MNEKRNYIAVEHQTNSRSSLINHSLRTEDDHGIRKTATAGYDPAANGAGESAIGFIKRKARQLIIGASLPTSWWGVVD